MRSAETDLKGLMVAALDGDERAYREALSRMSRYLRGYYRTRLSRTTGGSGDAEDLVQETLMAVHARRDTYDPEQPFTPWLYAIARYKLIDYLRRSRAAVRNLPFEDIAEVTANDDRTASESSFDLGRLLEQLPSKFRRAIQLVKLDGLSVSEAAVRAGTSESAIKVNVHRGMRALAALVGKEGKS